MSNEPRRGPGRPPNTPTVPNHAPDDASGGLLGNQVGEGRAREQEEAEQVERQRREQEEANAEQAAMDAVSAAEAHDARLREEAAAKKKKAEALVEVKLNRDYRPADSISDEGKLVGNDEVGQKISAGATISLPKREAARALKLGIASATDRTFDD